MLTTRWKLWLDTLKTKQPTLCAPPQIARI